MKHFELILAIAFTAASSMPIAYAFSADTLVGKKLIEWGWDEPDTTFIRRNIERMEQYPFDGLIFHLTCYRNGKPINFAWRCWSKERFSYREFEHAVRNLRATNFKRFTELFIRFNVCPGDVDWFNDNEWSCVLNNVGIAARVAKYGRCRGIMFDVEQYQTPLFDYKSQKHAKEKSFAEYSKMVRQRGREFIREINRYYPNITILLTFGYSITRPRGAGEDRSQVRYGLLADFLDGMLEACSPQTVIVDAWESSYPYKRYAHFKDAYRTIKERALEWTAVPDKYRKHVIAGFGLWMDCNWRRIGWHLDNFEKNHFTPKEFEYAVHCALRVSDKYVWIYAEQPRWWTNERLPRAYVQAVANARKPHVIDDSLPR